MADSPVQNVAAQQASATALTAAQQTPQTKTDSKKYYMPFNGAVFIMPSGKRLVFADGCLETSIKEEIEEIERAIASGAEISRTPQMVIQSDAVVMRDVGAKSKPSGTGMANSQTIAALAAESTAKK